MTANIRAWFSASLRIDRKSYPIFRSKLFNTLFVYETLSKTFLKPIAIKVHRSISLLKTTCSNIAMFMVGVMDLVYR